MVPILVYDKGEVEVRRDERELKKGEWVVGISANGYHFGGYIVSINKSYKDVTVRITGGDINLSFITVPKKNLWSAEIVTLDLDEIKVLMDMALDMKDYKWCRRLTRKKKIFMYYEGILYEAQKDSNRN